MIVINTLLILLIIVLCALGLTFLFKKDKTIIKSDVKVDKDELNQYSIGYLAKDIKSTFNDILHMNVEELNLNRIESEKRINNKVALRDNLRNCCFGDLGAKEYIKDYTKDLLQKKYQINESNIDFIIPFEDDSRLTCIDKFDIALYIYKQKYRYNALTKMIEVFNLDQQRNDDEGIYFEITSEDIERVYKSCEKKLDLFEKLEIISQRIYQINNGHGVIDEIRDMNIDGVSGGVYGIAADSYCYIEEEFENGVSAADFSYNGIAIMYKGKTIHLSFLGFGSNEELQRVCRNIYRYNSPGQLSQEKGYIENDMKDGSRVVVVRPPFSNSWAFFVRKHGNIESGDITNLITDRNKELPIGALKWFVKGCTNIVITGEGGSGKTTLLKALIKNIPRSMTLRIQEQIFELHLEKVFKKKNITTFKETPSVSGQEGVNLNRRTDGAVNILGEIIKYGVASWFIQMSQAGSKFTMCTHHAMTTNKLIEWMKDALLKEGGYSGSSVKEATKEVVDTIDFDVHMVKDSETGHRYIERITEIVPCKDTPYPEKLSDQFKTFFERMTNPVIYETRDIVRYENESYIFVSKPSDSTIKRIKSNLSNKEKEEFEVFWREVGAIE